MSRGSPLHKRCRIVHHQAGNLQDVLTQLQLHSSVERWTSHQRVRQASEGSNVHETNARIEHLIQIPGYVRGAEAQT